ncbi:MAG TPA: imidazole glycerol phosphate synthase subunit HisF [Candidatus Nanoarchaeia archaeon]|nr:imidazole glycerol phosphate synthase subunit HisF [Candidatus Nanoarchaeia archaeon]
MLTKRIIPCLDVKNGIVVKGTKFGNLKYAGNPVELAEKYCNQRADELVFLDITASYENTKTSIKIVEEIGKRIFIPFTVGGGISAIKDIRAILNAGADKVSINTAAIKNPGLIKKASRQFGSQCIVVAIDAKKKGKNWEVYIQGGRKSTGLDAVKWAKKAEMMGAGEILLTSIDKDGTKEGYDLELTKKVSESVNIPVIASGGANSLTGILEVFKKGKADAALAASIFHYKKFSIKEVKKYLSKNGIEVRI